MAKLTFKGGIHPYDGKELSKDKPIKAVLPKGDLVYPLSQHIGAPAKPIVAKGDHVLTGQKIAEAGGFVSAPVYATVSGTVKAIEPRRVVTGDNVMSIVVENDGLYDEVEYPAVKPLEDMTRDHCMYQGSGHCRHGRRRIPDFYQVVAERTGENRLCDRQLCGV